jgi:hypothetical protein
VEGAKCCHQEEKGQSFAVSVVYAVCPAGITRKAVAGAVGAGWAEPVLRCVKAAAGWAKLSEIWWVATAGNLCDTEKALKSESLLTLTPT